MPTTGDLLRQLKAKEGQQVTEQATTTSDLLNQLRGQQPQPPAGISPQPLNFIPGRQQEISNLQRLLGGRLPTQGPIPRVTQPIGLGLGGAGAEIGPVVPDPTESRRRQSFQKLLNLGFSSEEISSALAFEQAIKPPSRAPQTVGAFVGGLAAGRLIPGPVDDVLIFSKLGTSLLRGGAKAGIAALGGVAGKALQIIADPDADFHAVELAKVGGEEFALEAGTLGIARVGRRLIGGVKSTAIARAEILSKRLEAAGQKIGIKTRFLPAQFSEHQLIDTIQGIGENSLIGANTVKQFRKGQLKAGAVVADEMADAMSAGANSRSLSDMASLYLDAVEDRGISHSIAASQLYSALDIAIGTNDSVDIRSAKTLARKILGRAAKAGNIGQTEQSLNLLGRLADDVGDFTSFETAQDIRSGLLDIRRKSQLKLTADPKAAGHVKRLVPEIDAAMTQTAKNAGPEVEVLRRRADKFFKGGRLRFNNRTIVKLSRDLRDKPGAITVAFKPKNKTALLRIKKAVGPKVFQELKGTWLEQIVSDAQKVDLTVATGIGEPVGTQILKKFNGLGEDTLNAIFTPKEISNVRDSARILGIIQAQTGGQSGALRFVQGSALAGVAASPFVDKPVGKQVGRASGVLLIGPAVLGRMMTMTTFNKLLSEGLKAPVGSQQALALSTRMARNVFKARKEINEERRKRQIQRENEQRILTGKIPEPRLLGGFKR